MEERDVVTAFLRHDAEVLLLRRSDAVGSYAGQWGAVAGHVETTPEASARQEIAEETGLDPETDVDLAATGEPFAVPDRDLGIRWTVHPFLFDAARRDIAPNRETDAWDWVPAPEIRRRETVPDLWTSYDRVRPGVATVATDGEHGSAYLSLRALEVLRDEAALAGEEADSGPAGAEAGGWAHLAETAIELREARPAMPVVANRVNVVMDAAADERTPEAVETAALAAIERATKADRLAGAHAAERLRGSPDAGPRLATLSRSGTVAETLDRLGPASVLVAESRPGREGIGVAESLSAEGHDVTLTTDAGFAQALATQDVDALLVGADAVLPDGRIVNKVGTRAAATVAAHEGIEVLVVAATAKVVPAGHALADEPDLEPRDPGEVYEGTADLSIGNPTFDVTPPGVVDALVTEDGPRDPEDVAAIAETHRERAGWPAED